MDKYIFQIGRNRFFLNNLNPSLNEQFKNLHKAYLSGGTFEWNKLENSSHDFFDDTYDDYKKVDSYFNNFTPVWKSLLSQGLFGKAEEVWKDSLRIAIEWEENNDARIHKGTPYYFWGMTSILSGQIDKGFFLMHQALEEDIKTHGDQAPPTPARYFVLLNPEKQRQAFRRRVVEISDFLKSFLEKYRSQRNQSLNFTDFRSSFLEEVELKETAFSFVYDLFKFEWILKRTGRIKMSHAFGSIYQASLLFSLCRDIENLLSYKYQGSANRPTFYNYVCEELSPQGGMRLNKDNVGKINHDQQSNFESTVKKLLTGAYQFDDGTSPVPMEADVGIAYCFRNFGAHSIGDYPVIHENFEEIAERILNVLFLTLETLY